MEKLIYLGYETQEIQGHQFICVYVLNLDKKVILKIYKQYDEKLNSNLCTLSLFDEISNYCSFVIKRDGKIALDINIL